MSLSFIFILWPLVSFTFSTMSPNLETRAIHVAIGIIYIIFSTHSNGSFRLKQSLVSNFSLV